MQFKQPKSNPAVIAAFWNNPQNAKRTKYKNVAAKSLSMAFDLYQLKKFDSCEILRGMKAADENAN